MRRSAGLRYQMGYVGAVLALTGALLCSGLVLQGRRATARGGTPRLLLRRTYWVPAVMVGGGMLLAYGLTAAAYARAPANAVGATREVSIAFAALGGRWRFGERLSRARVAGLVLIFAGVIGLSAAR
jgi:drug/metabolite transporter (DMT)-like permease